MMDPEPSSTPYSSPYTESRPQNPYARTPSKRAISCVTCAKAKTKCNRALPSCSRCLAKGIKCEPRSTRRTSDNNRSSIKRRCVPPKRYHSMGSLSHAGQSASPANFPSLEEDEYRRSMSYDSYNAARTDHQTLALSGYPMLTPLPTHAAYIIDESHSYCDSPETSLASFKQTTSNSTLSHSDRLSPPTPEPMFLHEPMPRIHYADYHACPQTWYEDVQPSIEYSFDPGVTSVLPPEPWPTPNHAMTTHSTRGDGAVVERLENFLLFHVSKDRRFESFSPHNHIYGPPT
ncbi:hypothetical protein ACJQWK_02282 [Exserohilum turcicum]